MAAVRRALPLTSRELPPGLARRPANMAAVSASR